MTAKIIPENRRMTFLPNLFGVALSMNGERMVFDWARILSKDYNGGSWDFYEQNKQPLYMAPAKDKRFYVSVEGNGFEGEVSADAFGIICTLFALSHMSFRYNAEELSDAYVRLYEFAVDHAEASDIFQAID